MIICIRFVMEQVRSERDAIINQLMDDVRTIQNTSAAENVAELQKQIEHLIEKKHNAVDLMLEGIISKDDLKSQVAHYEKEIARLTQKKTECQNISVIKQQQIDGIRAYIEQINTAPDLTENDTAVYRDVLKKIVFYGTNQMDVYLNCVPFGFRLIYRKEKIPHSHYCDFIIESCKTI